MSRYLCALEALERACAGRFRRARAGGLCERESRASVVAYLRARLAESTRSKGRRGALLQLIRTWGDDELCARAERYADELVPMPEANP